MTGQLFAAPALPVSAVASGVIYMAEPLPIGPTPVTDIAGQALSPSMDVDSYVPPDKARSGDVPTTAGLAGRVPFHLLERPARSLTGVFAHLSPDGYRAMNIGGQVRAVKPLAISDNYADVTMPAHFLSRVVDILFPGASALKTEYTEHYDSEGGLRTNVEVSFRLPSGGNTSDVRVSDRTVLAVLRRLVSHPAIKDGEGADSGARRELALIGTVGHISDGPRIGILRVRVQRLFPTADTMTIEYKERYDRDRGVRTDNSVFLRWSPWRGVSDVHVTSELMSSVDSVLGTEALRRDREGVLR